MDEKPRLFCSSRLIIALMCFFITSINFMNTLNLSVAIICMVENEQNETVLNSLNNSTNESLSNWDLFYVKKSFNWTKKAQGTILGAVYFGCLISQIFAGWLSTKIGSKIICLISLFIQSILTFIFPYLVSNFDYLIAVLARFLIGITRGFILSSSSVLLVNWSPASERTTLFAISNSGGIFGSAFAVLFGGFLYSKNVFGGWPSFFIANGIISFCCCILWIFLVTDSPQNHNICTGNEEKRYIMEKTHEYSSINKHKKRTPWKDIMTSRPVIVLIITNMCSNMGISFFVNCFPIYLKEVLKFNIAQNGPLSAVTYLGCWLAIVVSGVLSDKIISSKKLSRLSVRKLFNTIGFTVPNLVFVTLIFLSAESLNIALFLILISITFGGARIGAGYLVNFVEISGSYSGLIVGIANTIGDLASAVVPLLMGWLTSDNDTSGWPYLFWIVIAHMAIGTLTFQLFAECEIQPWAKSQPLNSTDHDQTLIDSNKQ